VVSILNSVSKEDGSSKILERADLKEVYSDAQKNSR
jgi:hypothetical protein